VRPIGDWGAGMSGAHLRLRGEASQRDACDSGQDRTA